MSEEQAQSEPDDLEAGHKSPSASWPLQPAVLLRQMIQKITDQPFLFVIAIALLLITFALQGAQVGSGEFRFVVLVIALLAVFGMMGYYLMQLQPDLPEQKPDKPAAAPELPSASGGGSEKPTLPLSSPSSPLSTAIQDIDVWVEALAQSPTMQNRDTRLAVYVELPPEIRNSLNANLPNLHTQLRDLVRTCQNYPNGLSSLMQAVHKLEGDSLTVQHLRSLL